jgi:hypothetical protein
VKVENPRAKLRIADRQRTANADEENLAAGDFGPWPLKLLFRKQIAALHPADGLGALREHWRDRHPIDANVRHVVPGRQRSGNCFNFPGPKKKSRENVPFRGLFWKQLLRRTRGMPANLATEQRSDPRMTQMDADPKAIGMVLKMVSRGFHLQHLSMIWRVA